LQDCSELDIKEAHYSSATGRFLAELTKEVFADLEACKYQQMAEYRISYLWGTEK